jgi:hypothetical protein
MALLSAHNRRTGRKAPDPPISFYSCGITVKPIASKTLAEGCAPFEHPDRNAIG